jgi:hypothetical protein
MLFVAAAIAAAAPFAVPWLHGLHGVDSVDVRRGTALALSLVFLLGTTAFIGGTRLPRAIAERRIGFDLARPLSTAAIWGGTLCGTLVLAFGSALIAFVPAALAGDAKAPWSLAGEATAWWALVDVTEIPVPWPVLVFAAALLAFGLFSAAGVAIRARSPWIVFDLLAIPAAALAAMYGLIRLGWAGVGFEVSVRALVLVALLVVLALLLAGLAAVARGRTEIRAAHAAQSAVLWGTIAAGLLGLYGYGQWFLSAGPTDLTKIETVRAASRGPWALVAGRARGADASYLYDTAGGRYVRVLSGLREPIFSGDGSVAVWVQWLWKSTRLRVVDLRESHPSPHTVVGLAHGAWGLALDATGTRIAVIEEGGISVYALSTGRLLASARIEESMTRAFFLGPDRLRIYTTAPSDKSRLDILELDVSARRLTRTGSIAGLVGWPFLGTDATGRRLVCMEYEAKRTRLFDASTGALIAPLSDPETFSGGFRFLSDGRILLVQRRGRERVLEIRSPDGGRVGEIPFPGGPLQPGPQRATAIGGEPAAGQLVVATGVAGDRNSYLVSLDRGEVRRLGEHLWPAARWLSFFGPPNSMPPPGEPGATLFQADDGSIVRLDPGTGQRSVILGRDLH